MCLCVRRSRLHHLDAVSQPKLLHQPVDLHGVLQQRLQRAAESAALPVGARPPRLPTWRFHHHAHLHHQGQPVLTKTDRMEEDTRWHIWQETHGCTLDLLQGRDIALRRHYRLYLQHCRRADLYQMFPTTKDSRIVNKALSLITLAIHPTAKTGVIEVVNTVLWGYQKDTARKMQSGLEIKDIFTSAAVRRACRIHEKVRSDRAKSQECEGWVGALKRRSARLIYKAADKATGLKKNKQPTEGSGNNRRQTEKSADGPRTDMARMTWMLQLQREGPLEDCGRNAIMWTNVVKSEKVDYIWIRMLIHSGGLWSQISTAAWLGGVGSFKCRDTSPWGMTCVVVQTGGGDGHERIDMNNPGSIHQPVHNYVISFLSKQTTRRTQHFLPVVLCRTDKQDCSTGNTKRKQQRK